MAQKNKKKTIREAPKVHPDLNGFDYQINNFGEIKATMNIDDINSFLNKAEKPEENKESDK